MPSLVILAVLPNQDISIQNDTISLYRNSRCTQIVWVLWFFPLKYKICNLIVKILFLQNSSALNWYLMCQSDVMDGRTYVLIPTMSFGRFSRNLTSLLGPRLFSLYLTMCGFKILSLAVTKVPLAVLSVCQSWSYASLRAHKQFWTQFFLERNDQRRSWQENNLVQSSISPVQCYPCNWGSCLFVSAAMTDTLLIQCKSIGQSLFTAIGISPEPISGDRGINGLGIEVRSWKWS